MALSYQSTTLLNSYIKNISSDIHGLQATMDNAFHFLKILKRLFWGHWERIGDFNIFVILNYVRHFMKWCITIDVSGTEQHSKINGLGEGFLWKFCTSEKVVKPVVLEKGHNFMRLFGVKFLDSWRDLLTTMKCVRKSFAGWMTRTKITLGKFFPGVGVYMETIRRTGLWLAVLKYRMTNDSSHSLTYLYHHPFENLTILSSYHWNFQNIHFKETLQL